MPESGLFVHTNSDLFGRLVADKHTVDVRQYAMPEEVVLQFSHKDVYLEFFKERKRDVLNLQGGDALDYDNYTLYETVNHKPVVKLSKRMQTTLVEWEEKGYHVKSASVRFIVAWKSKDAPKDEPEVAVLLPDVVLAL